VGKSPLAFTAFLLCVTATVLPGAAPGPELQAAIDLFRAKKFPDARVALEHYVASHPDSAAGHYYLGRTLELRGDADALPEAIRQYEKAVDLDPENPA
jgi:tetratricopeptide (TPR) repeat protein